MDAAMASAVALCALCAWDIGRRYLSGLRKAERQSAADLAKAVETLRAEHDEHAQTVLRHERQLTDLRGSRVAEVRRPHLTGVNR